MTLLAYYWTSRHQEPGPTHMWRFGFGNPSTFNDRETGSEMPLPAITYDLGEILVILQRMCSVSSISLSNRSFVMGT